MFYDDRLKTIGKRIKDNRKRLGLTQKELLEKVYLSEKSVASLRKWENGERLPDLDTIVRMAGVFERDIGYMLADYDESNFSIHKICELTGLSDPAVSRLCRMEEKSIRERAAGWRGFPEEQELTVLNTLLEQGFYILYYLYQYLFESYDSFNFVVRTSENSVHEENRDDILLCCKDNPNKGTFLRAAEVQTVFLLKIQEEITKLKTQLNGGKRNG